MNTKKIISSVANKDKKGFVKLKNMLPKTPNLTNNNNDHNYRFKNLSFNNRNLNSAKLNTSLSNNEDNINKINMNSSIVSNGKVENSKEKALNLVANQENKIKKIIPNIRENNSNHLFNENSKKVLIRKQVNCKEDQIGKSFFNDKETIFTVNPVKSYRNDYSFNNNYIANANDKYEILKKNFTLKQETSFRILDNNNNSNDKKNKNNFSYTQKRNNDSNNNNNSRNSYKNKNYLNNHETYQIKNNTNNNHKLISSTEIQLTISPKKDLSISLSQEKQLDKPLDTEIKLLSTYERFENNKQLINSKKRELKRKIEEEELHEIKNTKNYEPGFLQRLEIYKLNSLAEKFYLNKKLKSQETAELNKFFKPKDKMNLQQIQKIISEKLNAQKIKKIEKQRKIKLLKLEELSKLNQCTFKPLFYSKNKEIDVSAVRRKYDLAKSKIFFNNSKENEFGYVRKYYNLDNLDRDHAMHDISYFIKMNHSKQKSFDELNSSSNKNKQTYIYSNINQRNESNNRDNNVLSDTKKFNKSFGNNAKNNIKLNHSFSSNNNCLTFNNNENSNKNKVDYIDQKAFKNNSNKKENILVSIKEENKIILSVPISRQNDFANSSLVISKRESDILRELLMKKLDG